MPVLPIIDLLILLGWTTLAAGGFLKAIYIATSYRPTLFSLGPVDLLLVAITFLALALTLAARTWVRLNEPRLTASRQAQANAEAVSRAVARDRVGAAQPLAARSAAEAPAPGAHEASPAGAGAGDAGYGWQRVR